MLPTTMYQNQKIQSDMFFETFSSLFDNFFDCLIIKDPTFGNQTGLLESRQCPSANGAKVSQDDTVSFWNSVAAFGMSELLGEITFASNLDPKARSSKWMYNDICAAFFTATLNLRFFFARVYTRYKSNRKWYTPHFKAGNLGFKGVGTWMPGVTRCSASIWPLGLNWGGQGEYPFWKILAEKVQPPGLQQQALEIIRRVLQALMIFDVMFLSTSFSKCPCFRN